MTIDLQTIDAESLGESASESEGEMRFHIDVAERRNETWFNLRQFIFRNDHTTLTPFSIRNFVSDPVVIIGPQVIGIGIPGIGLSVREFDDFPFADEEANTLGPKAIRVVPGEDTENDTLNFRVTVRQEDDPFDPESPLIVHLICKVTVEHVP
jgi:hypothetical protein